MQLTRVLSPIRLGLALTIAVVALIVVPRLAEEYSRSKRLGLLVVSIVREEFAGLSVRGGREGGASGMTEPAERLRASLVLDGLRRKGPAALGAELAGLARRPGVSQQLQTVLGRWGYALARWRESDLRIASLRSSNNFNSVQLLDEARVRFHEAMGYERIGRSFDATALLLWSAERAREFIESAPDHPALAEAVYLLGESYIRFRGVLPDGVRPDRFVNLCSELFPSSTWSNRSIATWRKVMVHGG